MSETKGNNIPGLTPTQKRFVGFVASHVHNEEPDQSERVRRTGLYEVNDSSQLLPFRNIVFDLIGYMDEDEEAIETAKITYDDGREDRAPWMELALYFDLFEEGSPEIVTTSGEPFCVFQAWEAERGEDDAFAKKILDRIELLEANGMLVRKGAGSGE
jgi:hypothetical protein